jgi:hypothetical protein
VKARFCYAHDDPRWPPLAEADLDVIPRADETVIIGGASYVVWSVSWHLDEPAAVIAVKTPAKYRAAYYSRGMDYWLMREGP